LPSLNWLKVTPQFVINKVGIKWSQTENKTTDAVKLFF
jgi:hypothetical protein